MYNEQELKDFSNKIRTKSIESIYKAQSGHPGGSLSIAEILSVLYNNIMHLTVNEPNNINRDRFILSKGHAAPAYYATLALKGYFPEKDLDNLRSGHESLQGHPSMLKTTGVDFSTGSLGQGLSISNGMALFAKKNKLDYKVFCLCGDGEVQEGQVWEAAMFSAHNNLDNLIMIIDNNGLQIDGTNKEVMNHEFLEEKFKAFNWEVIKVDGHDVVELEKTFLEAYKGKGKPICIIAKTIKGKGVSFMENQAGWHGGAPDFEQYQKAMIDLNGGCNNE